MATAYGRATVVGAVLLYSQTFAVAVDSDRPGAPIEVRTDDVVVTATRFPETDLDRPINMTVISRDAIERSPAKTVPEVLAAEVGFVNSELFGNNGASTSVDLRGFGVTGGENTLILVNGRRVKDNDLSGVKWSSIPLASVERIEVVRGSGSVLYGNGAVAGVVNIITKTSLDHENPATVGARYGDLDTREANINATYRSDAFGLSVSGSNYSSDGYRENNENQDTNLYVDARTLGESNDFSLQMGSDRQDLRLPGGRFVQPSIGLNELEDNRRGTSTPLDYATRDGAYATLGMSSRRDFGQFDAELGYREKAQTSYFYFGGFPDYRETDLEVWSLTPRARLPSTIGGRENQLVLGVDVYNLDYALSRSNDPQNIATPINRVRADQQNLGIYFQDTLRLSTPATLSFGWREEWQIIDATDYYDPTVPGAAFGSGAADGDQDLHEYAYDLGLRYELDMGWAATAKTGRSFRFATIDEIYETSPTFSQEFQFLRPQTAESADIGVERRWNGKMLRATAFLIDVEDEIHLDAYSTGIGNTNLPLSRRKGIEIESGTSFGTVGVRLTYAYTDARFLEGVLPGSGVTQPDVDMAGKTVPLVPRDKVTINADWAISGRTLLTAAYRYVSDQYMDNDEPNDFYTKIPAYSVVDVKLAHQRGSWHLGFVVNNLFDEEYYTYAVRSQFVNDRYSAYPLPERTATVFAEYRFGASE
jgi:iron complex outermembrane receptor protein